MTAPVPAEAPGRLASTVARIAVLSAGEVSAMYRIFAAHYDKVPPALFERDLREKDFAILLRELGSGALRGFSTQRILRRDGVRAVFSGDTVIDRAWWGEQELVRGWCRFAGQVLAAEPRTPLFWFLICKGYRTYLYLPLFFKEYYPRHDRPTPAREREVLEGLARDRFPSYFRPETGLLEFPESQGQLTTELAEVPEGRRQDPRVRFFLESNPRYAQGSELVCLTEVSAANMKGIARRSLLEGEAMGPLHA